MLFTADEAALTPDLRYFFSHLETCRNKNEHVHGLHPYPAKFIPHIPRALIGTLAKKEDVVLDPMCGSGTTLVEATLAGYTAIGVDINPIATLVSRAKTAVLSPDDRRALKTLVSRLVETAEKVGANDKLGAVAEAAPPEFHNRGKWFAPNVARELAYAKSLILDSTVGAGRVLALCAFSSIIVGVSNQESETRWCAKSQTLPDGATLMRLAGKLAEGMKRSAEYTQLRRGRANVLTADARRLPVDDCSVGLVVTSPPYANSHDYYLYNKLRMFWLAQDVVAAQQHEIGSRNRHSDMKEGIETYATAMAEVVRECRRVMRPGGALAIVVADSVIRGEFFAMDEIYNAIAVGVGFALDDSYRFGHRQFNSAFQRGFGTRRQKETHVLIYRADEG